MLHHMHAVCMNLVYEVCNSLAHGPALQVIKWKKQMTPLKHYLNLYNRPDEDSIHSTSPFIAEYQVCSRITTDNTKLTN